MCGGGACVHAVRGGWLAKECGGAAATRGIHSSSTASHPHALRHHKQPEAAAAAAPTVSLGPHSTVVHPHPSIITVLKRASAP